jgi:hypothetical protein
MTINFISNEHQEDDANKKRVVQIQLPNTGEWLFVLRTEQQQLTVGKLPVGAVDAIELEFLKFQCPHFEFRIVPLDNY